jgi:hypothetical protein
LLHHTRNQDREHSSYEALIQIVLPLYAIFLVLFFDKYASLQQLQRWQIEKMDLAIHTPASHKLAREGNSDGEHRLVNWEKTQAFAF